MSNYKVFYTDTGMKDISIEQRILNDAGIELILSSSIDEETLISEGMDCDAAIVEYAQITENVLKAWAERGRIRCVTRQGIGFDNIDVEAATKYGIIVSNIPDYCIDEVADHTITLVLCALREVKSFDVRIQNGEFEEIPLKQIHRIKGMNFCLYGFGNIARQVAVRAQAFGFRTYTYDPFIPDELCEKFNTVKINDLHELAEIADVMTVHAPKTKSTYHSVDATVFNKMKKTCVFVNTARGPLVDENALADAIINNKIAAVGLDVYEVEPLPADSRLKGRSDVILTSHVAYYSEESEVELREKCAKNSVAYIETGKPLYCVNREVLK